MTRPGCGDVDHVDRAYDSGPTHEPLRCDYCGEQIDGKPDQARGLTCCPGGGCLHELLDVIQKEREDNFNERGEWFPPPTSGW